MNIVCVSSVYTFLTICYFVQNICSDVCLINVPSINLHLSGSSLLLTLHCIFHHIIIYYYNNNLHLPGSSLVLTLHCIFQPHNILYNYISIYIYHTLYHLWKMKQNKLNNNVKREKIFNLMNCFCLAQRTQQSCLLPAAALTSWAI